MKRCARGLGLPLNLPVVLNDEHTVRGVSSALPQESSGSGSGQHQAAQVHGKIKMTMKTKSQEQAEF